MSLDSQVTVLGFQNKEPKIHSSVFLAHGCRVIGDVSIQKDSSLWYNVVCRGDVNSISIGSCSNIQDNSLIHVNHDGPIINVGDYVTVGHNVVLHGCSIKNNSLIGMGSCLLDGVVVGSSSFVAAGSLLTPNKVYPSGVLIQGRPAKVIRDLTQDEIDNYLLKAAHHYVELKNNYLKSLMN